MTFVPDFRLILLIFKGTGKLVGFFVFIVFVALGQLPSLTYEEKNRIIQKCNMHDTEL